MNTIVEHYLQNTKDEDPGHHRALAGLVESEQKLLAGLLGRFDIGRNGTLSAKERLAARRVLARIRKPTADTLELANKVLDYLDLNANSTIDHGEMELCLEIVELFASAESEDGKISRRELKMLYAVLRNLDSDNSGKLERPERDKLRHALEDPAKFLAREKEENPLLKELG